MRRLAQNGLLFLLLVAILAAWFAQHISLLLEIIPVGAVNVAILVAVATAVYWVIGKAKKILVDKKTDERVSRRIRKWLIGVLVDARTGWALLIASLCAVVVYFGTTSSFVVNELASGDPPSSLIRLVRGDDAIAYTLSSADRVKVQGDFNFPDFYWFEQRIEVERPVGKQVAPQRVGWVRSVRVRVPADFQIKSMRVFRILPPPSLLRVLPQPLGRTTHRCHLKVYIDNREINLGSVELSWGSICLGSDSREDIEWFLTTESEEDRNRVFTTSLQGLSLDGGRDFVDAWQSHLRIIQIPAVSTGSTLRIEVIAHPTGEPLKEIARGTLVVSEPMTIQTIPVEYLE